MAQTAPRCETAAGRSSRQTVLLVARSTMATLLGCALLWWLIPVVSGASWGEVGTVLLQLSMGSIALLSLVWIAGLLAYSWVLTGALPGLTHRRALTLNMTGSAVSNIAPLGGALGVALNLKMTRSWKVADSSFAAFTLVTNIWDVLAKLVMPLVALVALLVHGADLLPSLRVACIIASLLIALVVGALVLWLASSRAADELGRLAAALARRLPGRHAARAEGLPAALAAARADTVCVVSTRWHQLTLATIAYLVLQAGLLWLCLHLVGVPVALTTLLAAFAVERLGSLAVITPGGIGVGEAATVAVLVALGSPPVAAAAGLLLFRCFTFLVEIPVGGVWLAGWLVRQSTVRAA